MQSRDVLYANLIKTELSFIATKCDSWNDFKLNKSSNNIKIPLGHKMDSRYISNDIIHI